MANLRDIHPWDGSDRCNRTVATGAAEAHAGWLPYKIEVLGADHEGIIHKIAQTLSKCGINIESMDTVTTQAPNSGASLFSMTALVVVPPDLPGQNWEAALEEVGHRLHVDIKVSAAAKQ